MRIMSCGLIVVLGVLSGVVSAAGEDLVLEVSTEGWFHVRNREHGDLLRPRNASGADGVPIVLYPRQPWKCLSWQFTAAGGEDLFRLRNRFTDKSIGGAADEVRQVPFADEGRDAPAWRFQRLEDGAYRVGEPGSDRVLTAVPDARGGVRVVLAPWRGTDAQKWELVAAPANPAM